MNSFLSITAAFLALAATTSFAEIREHVVEYLHGDVVLEGRYIFDDTTPAPRPGVVIFHQWAGPTEHETLYGHRIAKLGYAAFVADIYGKGVRPATQEERVAEVTKYKSNRSLLRARANLALVALGGQPGVDTNKLAACGFCFGGTTALELSRSGAPVRGVTSFHGGLGSPTPADASNIKGSVQVLHGADDPYVPPAEVAAFEAEMRDAKADWQLVSYGNAVHAFTQKEAGSDNSAGAAYNEDADRRSWKHFNLFLQEIFE